MELKITVGLLALAKLVASTNPLTVTTTGDIRSLEITSNIKAVPNTFIIELDPGSRSDLSASRHFRSIDSSSFETRQEFQSKYFYGLSATFGDDVDVQALRNEPGVKNVWSVPLIPRPRPFELSEGSLAKRGTSSKTTNGTTLPNYRGDAKVNNPLHMSNVQQLHDKGIKGKGIQVAVVDSGVDYNHPSLGGGFGPGFKVSMGHDFVGDDYDGSNTPMPDDDPLDNCPDSGHGTHCAGKLCSAVNLDFLIAS